MGKLFLKFNKKDCMGCHACEVACKQENRLGVGPQIIKVIENLYDYTPVYCRQCAKPPCKDACPQEAIYQNDDGVVLINKELCIGCRACVEACPFDAMQFEDDKETAVKCNMCLHRLEEGKKPACASFCPTQAISVGEKKSIAAVFEDK